MAINTNYWNKVRYSIYAPVYDILAKSITSKRRRSIELLNIKPKSKVLIMGAGTGLDLELLPNDIEITAIDLTPAMVNKMEKRAKKLKLKANLQIMDAQNLTFNDNQFDYVILHLIIAVIPDPHKCIKEAERVLKHDGKTVIFDKFLPDDQNPSLIRKWLNWLTNLLFSDINRRISDIIAVTNFKEKYREDAGFGGLFQIVLIQK